MRKIIIISLFLISSTISLSAQDYYRTAVGIRVGTELGITVKHFVGNASAVEGIISTRWRGFIATALYEFENIAFNTPGLNWYVGGGGHLGIWPEYYSGIYWWNEEEHPEGYTIVGADFIIGLDYTFKQAPLNIAIDWKPAINFFGHTGFWIDFAAISIRYAFINY